MSPEESLRSEVVRDGQEGDIEEEDKLLKEVEVESLSHCDQISPELSNTAHLSFWTNPPGPVVHLEKTVRENLPAKKMRLLSKPKELEFQLDSF